MMIDPSGYTNIGDLYYSFSGTEATVRGITSAASTATSLTIPGTVESGGTTYTVTAIYSPSDSSGGIFREMTSLQTLVLPDSLVTIGRAAFYNCSALADTTLPAGLKTIGWSAFFGCTALADISLPSGLITLDGYSFSKSGLTTVTIPDTVTNVGIFAFSECTSLVLADISLPSGLTSIGDSAFYKCAALADISLPSGLTSIGKNTFRECTSLVLTSLPSRLTSIGNYAFNGCESLESLSIPLATTNISSNAFIGCTNLTLSLDISVTAGGDTDTVQWVTGLNSGAPTCVVTAPTSYNNMFLTNWTYSGTDYNGGDSITMSLASRSITANLDPNYSGTCGDSLSWILYTDYSLGITGTGAMYDYAVGNPAPWDSYKTSILSVSIPAGMTSIGQRAFDGCTAITALTIPLTVTTVGLHAFNGCTSLVLSQEVSVTYEGNTTTETWTTSTDADGTPTFASTIPANPVGAKYKWTYGGTTYKAGETVTMSAADRAILKVLFTSFPLLVNGVQMNVVKILVKQSGTWTVASKTLVKQSGSWVEPS